MAADEHENDLTETARSVARERLGLMAAIVNAMAGSRLMTASTGKQGREWREGKGKKDRGGRRRFRTEAQNIFLRRPL